MTAIGKPIRERTVEPDVIVVPPKLVPAVAPSPDAIPDHLPDTITLPAEVPA